MGEPFRVAGFYFRKRRSYPKEVFNRGRVAVSVTFLSLVRGGRNCSQAIRLIQPFSTNVDKQITTCYARN